MTYPLLRLGDKLPAVGVAQKLLNARAGSSLVADGDYGNRTRTAVVAYQRSYPGLAIDGTIGIQTWPRLKANTPDVLRIVDCVDVFDPDLYNLEAADIRRAGGDPLLIG